MAAKKSKANHDVLWAVGLVVGYFVIRDVLIAAAAAKVYSGMKNQLQQQDRQAAASAGSAMASADKALAGTYGSGGFGGN